MTTAGDLVTLVSEQLHGWGSTQDRITPLAVNAAAGDTAITVDFAFGQSVGITPGVIEIDSELLYVTSVDPNTGICQLAHGLGRGYLGSTVAAHTAGAAVISRPRFPRVTILNQMNDIIGSLYPDIFQVKTWTGVVTYPSNSYTLPTIPLEVVDVQWQDPIGNWRRLNAYTVDPFDGKLRLGGGALIGRPLRVAYKAEPVQFASEADNFTLTGLPNSTKDLLTLGVVAKQAPALDVSRAQTSTVEQSDRSRVVPPFAGVNFSKYIEALYQERLQNEIRSLRRFNRPRLVKVW